MSDQLEMLGATCMFITGKKKVLSKGKKEDVSVFCGKVSEQGYTMCPKHLLISRNDPEKRRQAALKGIARREHRQALAEALMTSPLRSFNPAYVPKSKGKKKAAYIDASI